MRVFIDRGHGPSNRHAGVYDPGAVAYGTTEHGVISALVEDVLSRPDPPCPLVVTPEIRLNDLIVWLNEHATEDDVILALHMNSSEYEEATGVEVVISSVTYGERIDAAKAMVSAVASAVHLRKRGVISDRETPQGMNRGLAILTMTKAPAYLLELGFISNPYDVAEVLAHGADAILAGIRTLLPA